MTTFTSEDLVTTLKEADWRTDDGKRRCVDCGGWQLEQGHTSIFFPVLVAENVYGFMCEMCVVARLNSRAQIITDTSSKYYSRERASRLLSDYRRALQEAIDARLLPNGEARKL